MSFETGIPVSHVREMHEKGIDLKRCAKLISEAFSHMIYEEGFVHSDPHPGNIFVRPKESDGTTKGSIEIVLLDHGIYTDMNKETRLSYNKLWRGIITQNERKLKEASRELGADIHELFAGMIVGRTWPDIMNEKNLYNTKTRLGESTDPEIQKEITENAIAYHKEIVSILSKIKRELLLILKTNNYLRAIDKRLGNPNNSYNIINNVTWRVFCNEMKTQMGRWEYMKEVFMYYFLKLVLDAYLLKVRFLNLFGIKASKEEL